MGAPSNEYSGFLFEFDEPERTRRISQLIDDERPFTDTLSDSDWPLEKREIFLVIFNKMLSAVALVTTGRIVATDKRTIKFERYVRINQAIDLSELQSEIGQSLSPFVAHASSGSGRRLEEMWTGVLLAAKRLRPSIAADLDKLLAARELPEANTEQPGYRTMVEQKDAVNLALRIAGFDHDRLSAAPLPIEHPMPFLSVLGSIMLREDKMIANDAHVPFFGDLKNSHQVQSGAVVFSKGDERLVLMDVNRHPIEEAIGVDLLYYSDRYRSFVLVQYKRLTQEGDHWRYRPSGDKNLQNELERMTRCQSLTEEYRASLQELQSFRLYPDPFHFKFCQSKINDPASTEMISGFYLPLTYLIQFMGSNNALGPRNGVYVGEDNIGRHYSNTLFIDLVRNGWVGSSGTHSDVISRILEELIKTGKSPILAAHYSTAKNIRGRLNVRP